MGAPASPLQVARNGHVAASLRAFMTEKGWTPYQFNEAMGRPRDNNSIYTWLGAKGAPAPALRPKLSELTGIPLEDLTPRFDDVPRRRAPEPIPPEAWGRSVTITPKRTVPPARAVAAPKPPADQVLDADHVLDFAVTATGEARIRLDVTLALDKASAVLRLLLDANILLTSEPG